MINASASHHAAKQLSGASIVNYLSRSGWTIVPSKAENVIVAYSDAPEIFFVVPIDDSVEDSLARRADALRTIASKQGTTLADLVQAISEKTDVQLMAAG